MSSLSFSLELERLNNGTKERKKEKERSSRKEKKRKERDREPVDKFVVGRIFHGLLDKDGEGHKIKEALRHDRWSWWSRWW